MSDQHPKILSKLLQEYDLSPDKWVPLFHNEGITRSPLIVNKCCDETLMSNADTEVEKEALSKLLEILHSTDSELKRELEEAGLEPMCWLSIFNTQLGVWTLQGLQHTGSESYADLERFAHTSREKKALRKLLGIVDEETAMKLLRKKQKEKLHQREERSQQMLSEVEDLQRQGKDCCDMHLIYGVQEALQIPRSLCIVNESSLETLLSGLKLIIDQLDGELKARRDLNDVEVLERASGGRALQGILVSRNLEDQFEIRENLLSVPQDAQLYAPSLSQDDKIEVFLSRPQEDQFTTSMDRLGYSATASAVVLNFGFQMSASYHEGMEEEKGNKHHQKETYCSTIKCSFVPMASFYFKNSQLQLSADALRDLQAIEVYSGSALQEQCELFFRKYGSHAIKGQLHFGGIYWLKCYSHGFDKSDLAEVKKLQSQAVTASVSLSHGCFGASVEGNVSKLKANFEGDYSEALMCKTTVEVTKYGGPQAASNLPIWKSGLVASNFTWNVIDCGNNRVPVWEIIQMNHMKSFQDPKRLLQILIVAWEKMTKLQAQSLGGKIALQEEIDSADVLIKVGSWNDEKDQHKCEQHLKELERLKLDLAKRSMTPRAWPVLYLSKQPVQTYLKWVVKVTENKTMTVTEGEIQGSPEYIKLLMRQLVDPSDLNLVENFPDKHCISKWLYQSDRVQDILPLECKDLLSLQNFLKQALEDLYIAQTESGMKCPQQEAKIYATTYVAQVVNHLRNHLHKANQKYEDLFIVTMLYPFGYDASEKIFLCLLSTEYLKYLIENLDKQTTEYFSLKETSLLRKQAYLFYLAVCVFDNAASIDVSETHVIQHLLYMQNTLQDDLLPQVEDAITNHMNSDTGYDWIAIQSDLSSLMSGLTQEHEGPALEVVLQATPEARDDISIAAQDTATDKGIHPTSKLASKTGAQNEAFQALLKMINLEKYYPQKLTPTDAVCIRKETLGSLQHTEQPELLPYFIMQKIMMQNYRSRTNILHTPEYSADTDSDSNSDSNSDSDDDQFFDAEENHIQMTLRDVHPMDGLLALLHCADNFLRQDLIAKLSTCKLAMPFVLPDPKTQILTLPLWAMRSIVMEWKSKDGDVDCRIVDFKTPIVSFLRFSESESISKSKMLNDVIGDSEHDFFFHWDCEEGNAKRILMDGLIEVCWYLPAGKEGDRFPNTVTFTNLRGDARKHDKQARFLGQVSFMNFVILTQKDLNDGNGITVLQNLARAPGGLVLMFSDASENDKVSILKETLPRKMYSRIKLKKRSAATIKNEICRQITKKLCECTQKSVDFSKQLSLTDCARFARDIGIYVDEDVQECREGKQLAATLVDKILSLDTDPDSTASTKNKMLPLQGPKLWHTWAKHDKEQHRHLNRGSRGIEQYNSEKEKDKLAVRRRQLELTNSPTPVVELFISTLLKHRDSIREYFLQWLKLLLDDRSREKLPELQRQYKAKRKEINQLKDRQDVDTSTLLCLEQDLQRLNEKLLQTSFGLEHLLRELGQIYESVWDVLKLKNLDAFRHKEIASKHFQFFRLPQIAAELLVAGYPLELVDGDATHLPLTWVNAVLDNVKQKLGDKRIFILSVLGIQSTGKSTLINTMFGLQFTVSAGRCTQGAFIQLLPLNEQLKEDTKCDYFLVVDTEGLRTPVTELDLEGSQKHDNEMATFVIGLADVTIINIFGESPGDMADILQTAVHAFLRMKKVELDPSCQFVHQNVAAISADARGRIERDSFHEKLNEMTKAAAKEEQCEGEYRSFNDVISFDEERDIWYFPTLWKGDPPMAPVNPGYSDNAQNLRSSLIEFAKQKQPHCRISGFQLHMKRLWKAVLSENFVFSFKNTLEITAYNELDAEYNVWSWTLRQTMLKWEQENETIIKNSPFEKLHDLKNERITNAKRLLAEVHQQLNDDIKTFFQESKHSAILAQWQDRTERRLDCLYAECEKQAEEHCRTLILSREAHISVDRIRDSFREELREHIRDLVSRLEGKKLSDAELESMFENEWIAWMQDFTARVPRVDQQKVDIATSIESCLRDLLRKYDPQIIAELSVRPLRNWGKPLHLPLQPVKHLQSCRLRNLRTLHIKGVIGIANEDIEYAQKKTESFLDTAKQYLQNLTKRRIQFFDNGFIYELFNKLFNGINELKSENHSFRVTQQYWVDISLTVGGYALCHFEEMVEVIRQENDPIEYLKTLKVPFSKTCKSLYSQSAKEKTAADNLCCLLKKPILSAVTGSLGYMVANDMKIRPTFHSKRALKAQILLDLGEKKSFEDFALYLTDVKASLEQWVKIYLEQHCTHSIGDKSRLEELSETKLQEIIVTITEAAKDVTHSLPLPKEANISDWLSQLHRRLSSVLTFDEGELKVVVGVEDLTDFHYFKEEVIKGFRKIQESLLENFRSSPLSQMNSWSKPPQNILCDVMLGCCEQCPFCKEVCELTTPNHECKHSVELHRPECLGGCHQASTDEMVLAICSSRVASDSKFSNADTGHKYRLYKEYLKYYPNWNITADTSLEASSYWKWFVANFSSQIAKHFSIKETEIPDTWTSLKWEEVKEHLKTLYNL